MKIKLNEISTEGDHFSYTNADTDLTQHLADLLGKNPFKIDLYIRPLNTKDFTVSGQVLSQAEQECARCGDSFVYPIKRNINEILIPGRPADRQDKFARSSVKISDESETISVTEYSHQQFHLGEFLHEAVALELPFVAQCKECEQNKDLGPLVYDEKMGEETKPSPFQALKGLKLN